MKACSVCKKVPSRQNQSMCGDCRSKYTKRWYAHNSQRRQKYMQEWRRANRARLSDYQREYRTSDPVALKAHAAVQNAVVSGKLVRPERCQKCQAKKKLDAHHPNYKRPLDVLWICRSCHRAEDRSHA